MVFPRRTSPANVPCDRRLNLTMDGPYLIVVIQQGTVALLVASETIVDLQDHTVPHDGGDEPR